MPYSAAIMLTLSVETRPKTKARVLRRSGKLPGVVYGAHQEATALVVDSRQFEKVLRDAGEATIVTLSGLDKELPVLIHEVDLDPLTNKPRHVDFYAVTKGQKVEVAIPLEYVGESPAVRAGANVVKVLHEIEVEADPMNLPPQIEVDISVLANIDDQIRASDLKLPAWVALAGDPEELLALVQAVADEAAEAPVADIADIEVEKKGKEEEAQEG